LLKRWKGDNERSVFPSQPTNDQHESDFVYCLCEDQKRKCYVPKEDNSGHVDVNDVVDEETRKRENAYIDSKSAFNTHLDQEGSLEDGTHSLDSDAGKSITTTE